MRSKLKLLPWVILLLPIDLIVALALFMAQIYGSFKKPLQLPVVSSRNNAATIVIVNWDGKHLLTECLPSVVEAVKKAGGKHDIVVVDNGSVDGSVQFLKERFPDIRTLSLNRNYGFGGGNNRAAEEIRTDLIVFLNNDMVVDQEFLNPLLEGFEDESVFAVTSQIFFAD